MLFFLTMNFQIILKSSYTIKIITKLKLPLIIGGGIKSINQIEQIHKAGANIAVIGNHIENDESFLEEIKKYKKSPKIQEAL